MPVNNKLDFQNLMIDGFNYQRLARGTARDTTKTYETAKAAFYVELQKFDLNDARFQADLKEFFRIHRAIASGVKHDSNGFNKPTPVRLPIRERIRAFVKPAALTPEQTAELEAVKSVEKVIMAKVAKEAAKTAPKTA